MRAVTLKVKRYKYVAECPSCKNLFDSRRIDAITCGTDCRVWAHRKGNIKQIRELSIEDGRGYSPAHICQYRAAKRLIPEDVWVLPFLFDLDLDEYREKIWHAYREYLKQPIKARQFTSIGEVVA